MEMKKLLAIGIIFLFIGVAVAPSINSIIVKASKDINLSEVSSRAEINGTMRNKTTFQSESILFKRISDIIKKGDSLKHPLLYNIVKLILISRIYRALFLLVISTSIESGWNYYVKITHPLLFLRCVWLIISLDLWELFWNHISGSQGWNWPPL